MADTVLLIDDDKRLSELLSRYFSSYDLALQATASPGDGLRRIKEGGIDAVILDVMLPEMDGFEACRRIRQISAVPVIMLTARGELSDKVLGLELGSDDYLPKPFEPRELVARVKALLRRRGSSSAAATLPGQNLLNSGGLELDSHRFIARLNGVDLNLSTMEFELLELFLRNQGQILSRDQIMNHLKNSSSGPFDRSIDVLVSRLRKRLGDDPANPEYIKTIRSLGYMYLIPGGAK